MLMKSDVVCHLIQMTVECRHSCQASFQDYPTSTQLGPALRAATAPLRLPTPWPSRVQLSPTCLGLRNCGRSPPSWFPASPLPLSSPSAIKLEQYHQDQGEFIMSYADAAASGPPQSPEQVRRSTIVARAAVSLDM